MLKKYKSQLLNALLFCVVPGLLPFSAEPHIVGKVRWVMGGAVGMQPMDYFDLVLHGSPLCISSMFWLRCSEKVSRLTRKYRL